MHEPMTMFRRDDPNYATLVFVTSVGPKNVRFRPLWDGVVERNERTVLKGNYRFLKGHHPELHKELAKAHEDHLVKVEDHENKRHWATIEFKDTWDKEHPRPGYDPTQIVAKYGEIEELGKKRG